MFAFNYMTFQEGQKYENHKIISGWQGLEKRE